MPLNFTSVTYVIWDVVDFPLPNSRFSSLQCSIKEAIKACDYPSLVSIMAFGGKLENLRDINNYLGCDIEYKQVNTNEGRDTAMLMTMINFVYCQKLHRCFKDIHILLAFKDIPLSFGPVFDKLKSSFHGLHIHLVQDMSELIGNRLSPVLFDHVELVWAWETLTSGGSPRVRAPLKPRNRVVPEVRSRPVRIERLEYGSLSMESHMEGSLCVAFKVLNVRGIKRSIASSESKETSIASSESKETSIASSESAEINIFWNVVDFPIPPGQDLYSFLLMIKSALESEGYHGALSIKAYGSADNLGGRIPFVCHEDSYSRLHHMLSDIRLSALVNFNPYSTAKNLMVLADYTPNETEFVILLDAMTDMHYNVLLAVHRYCWKLQVPQVKKVWLWESLIRGEKKAIEYMEPRNPKYYEHYFFC